MPVVGVTERHKIACGYAQSLGVEPRVLGVFIICTTGKHLDPLLLTCMPGFDVDPPAMSAINRLVDKMLAADPGLATLLDKSGDVSLECFKLRSLVRQCLIGQHEFSTAAVSAAAATATPALAVGPVLEDEQNMTLAVRIYGQLKNVHQLDVPYNEQLQYALVAKLARSYANSRAFTCELEVTTLKRQAETRKTKKHIIANIFRDDEEDDSSNRALYWRLSRNVEDLFLAIAGILAVEISYTQAPLGGGISMADSALVPGQAMRIKGLLSKCQWMARAINQGMGQVTLAQMPSIFEKAFTTYNVGLAANEVSHDDVVDGIRKYNMHVFDLTDAEKAAATAAQKEKRDKEIAKEQQAALSGKGAWQQGKGKGKGAGGKGKGPGGRGNSAGRGDGYAGNYAVPNVPCRNFLAGRCDRGANCRFSHAQPAAPPAP